MNINCCSSTFIRSKAKEILMVALIAFGFFAYPLTSMASPVGEVEPNDTNFTTTPLLPGQYGQGNIATAPEYDGWLIQNVHTNQFFCMLLNAIEAAPGGNDPVMSIYFNSSIDDTINSDVYNDDGGPPSDVFKDSFVCGEKVKRAGSLFVRADGFGSATLQPYNLYQVVISPNEVLPEVEPNDSAATAMPIQSPAISANNAGGDIDFYSFNAFVGERIVVMIDSDPGRPDPATPFSPVITLFDSDGVTDITESVPGEHLLGATSYGALPAPHTGTYYVRIAKSAGDDGDYRLVVLVDGASPTVGACCALGTCDLRSETNCRGKFGGIGTVCGGDTDADGYANGCDNCSAIANGDQADADTDEVGDLCDTCATDQLKVIPGACGCGTKDTDTDGDAVADCNDQCPADARESIPGACGCGVVENDGNGNGIFDCLVGEDSKASLRSQLGSLNSQLSVLKTKKKPSKKVATALKDILSQIDALVKANGSQIGVKSGVDLNAEIANLTKILTSTLKSKAKKLKKNKASSLKQVQTILDALA